MAEKVIQTRIINKHGALADWLTSTTVLKEGEIALAYVETTKPDGQGGTYTVPTYLMKVGDGTNTFSGLEWVAAPASDVYEWAKKANLALSDIPMADVKTNLQDTFYTESEIDGKISTINTAINGKAASSHVHGSITNDGKLGTASRVVVTDGNKNITVSSAITTTELGYLDGVTSKIQTQLDGKAAKATTLAGYGITDSYTKSESDALLADKSDNHTHPYLPDTTTYAGSSTKGGAANSVKSNLVVKLNSGSTEGTNLFTFNGSAAKTINITPSAIGASASGHTHDDRYYTEGEIDTKLAGKSDTGHNHDDRYYTETEVDNKIAAAVSSALKYKGTVETTSNLPTSGQVTGDVYNVTNACTATSTLPKVNAGDNVAWNGSSWDVLAGTVDLSGYYTSSTVDSKLAGKSDTGHTHNYAGSSSAGGAANSVKAALTFSTSGNGAGNSTTYNGSTARTISYNSVGAAPASHTHTVSQITDFEHNHDDRYYTESEADARFAPVSHGTHVTTATVKSALGTGTGTTKFLREDGTWVKPSYTSDTHRSWSVDGTVVSGLSGTKTAVNLKSGTNVTVSASGTDITIGAPNVYTKAEVNAELAKKSDTHDHPYLSNTTKYAASSSVGGAATSANKVNSNLAIKLNSGTTEGTNLFTFNGSAAKTVNITASAVGAYTKSEIDSKVSAINTSIDSIFDEIVFDCGGPNN